VIGCTCFRALRLQPSRLFVARCLSEWDKDNSDYPVRAVNRKPLGVGA